MAEYSVKYWQADGSSATVGGFATRQDARTYALAAERDPARDVLIHVATEVPHREGVYQAELVETISPTG